MKLSGEGMPKLPPRQPNLRSVSLVYRSRIRWLTACISLKRNAFDKASQRVTNVPCNTQRQNSALSVYGTMIVIVSSYEFMSHAQARIENDRFTRRQFGRSTIGPCAAQIFVRSINHGLSVGDGRAPLRLIPDAPRLRP